MTLSALLLLAMGFNSCSSDDNDQPVTPVPVSTGATTFKLDGVLIAADSTNATLYTNSVAGGRFIDIVAFKGGDQILELHFPAKTGNFPAGRSFSMASSWLTYMANDGASYPDDYYHSDSGTMALSVCDTIGDKLTGTFNFVGNNETTNRNISEGQLVVNKIRRN